MSVRFVFLLHLLLVCLLSACASASAAPLAQTELTAQQWRDDLKYLAEQLRTRHPNPFYKTPEGEFDRAVNELDAAIPNLSRDDIVAGFVRIAAMIDGHTQIRFWQAPVSFHYYELRLYDFSDGIFAIDATAPNSNVIGARLVKIGDTNIEDAYPRVSMFANRDNVSTVRLLTPLFLIMPEVLHAQGLVRDINNPRFVFEKANGERVTVNPKMVLRDEYVAKLPGTFSAGLPKREAPMMQARKDEIFWSTFLSDTKTLYIQYNEIQSESGGQPLYDFAARLDRFVNENDVARVVVDVRHNGGGDNHTYPPMLGFLKDNPKINQRGKLFLITGRQTFSAAANFSTEVEQKTNALIAGEPMGGSPNLYGDVRAYTLPNSKIPAYISARTWIKSTPDDPRFSIEPQIPVELASQDYFAQRDPVLETILKYKPRASNEISATTRVVSFTASYSATLNGTLYGDGTTAVIFSNMGANKQNDWSKVAERVAQRGYMALTYDNRYWRANGTIDDSARVFVPDDLLAAMRFVREQGAQRIVLIGASLGSMASVKVAADTNPAAVVIMASPIDRKDLPFLVTGDDVRAIASPKLFLVAENDELGFTSDVKKMYDMARAPKQLKLFSGKAHGTDIFKTSAGDAVIGDIMEFLETHVRLPRLGFFDTVNPQPIVTRGAAGAWDDRFVDPGAVIFHDGMFHMLRNGFRDFPASVQIGYAVSRDGLTWSKQGNDPVLKTEQVPYAGVAALASSVLVENDGTWVLYFYTWETKNFPSRGGIGRATAKNPTGPWTIDKELVLKAGSAGEWDENHVLAPDVFKTDNGYVMYYSAYGKNGAQKIGRATSTDGIHWTKYNDAKTTSAPYAESDPNFDVGTAGEWDAGMVHQPRVRKIGNEWVMFYRGTPVATGNASLQMALGYATSADGIHWTRARQNPILKPNAIPNADYFWFTNVVTQNDTVYLFWEVDIDQKTEVYMATHYGALP